MSRSRSTLPDVSSNPPTRPPDPTSPLEPPKMEPETARGSSGPAGATNATPGPADTLGVPDSRQSRNPVTVRSSCERKHAAKQARKRRRKEARAPRAAASGTPLRGRCDHDAPPICSLCSALLLSAAICGNPGAHHAEAVAGVTSVTVTSANIARSKNYNADWPRDSDGNALVTFTNYAMNRSVTLPCFVDFRDPETGIRLPLCPCTPKVPGWIIEIISGLTPNAFKECAAHLPGRDTGQYGRMYLTVPFFRDYYFVAEHSTQRETRASRKWKIRTTHRAASCSDPNCRKRHRR